MPPAIAPEGLRPPGGRPRDEDRRTRKPLPLWDRIKFLVLLTAVWFLLVLNTASSNPLIPVADAFRIQLRSGFWVIVLAGLEVLRQIHFLISEHWAGYHQFWTHKVFGGAERLTHRRLSDWTRFRLWRLALVLFWIAVIAVIAGRVTHQSPAAALLKLPSYVWHALPLVFQILAASANPRSGLCAMADQARTNQARTSRSRNFTRSQNESGLRVRRSSSRGRSPGGRSPSTGPAGAVVISCS